MRLLCGDSVELLRTLADCSVDAVVTDPPYPCIKRPYGYWTEDEWLSLMRDVVREVRRVLKPSGSAMFLIQPNSERLGSLRPWMWDFMAWASREWNVVQDVWWWNHAAAPTAHCNRKFGLCRPSLKLCAWLGNADCARFQDRVLWTESDANKAVNLSDRALRKHPSGQSMRPGRVAAAAKERGGVTPFNLIPLPNTNSRTSGGAHGHGAATPLELCRWWAKYLTPHGGTVLDPFMGTGTTGVAATEEGFDFVGIERDEHYFEIAEGRLAEWDFLS